MSIPTYQIHPLHNPVRGVDETFEHYKERRKTSKIVVKRFIKTFNKKSPKEYAKALATKKLYEH